ncbi:50S ribosomal protein L19 [bacterium]|nr:50S ribosomal protein L19 [bacterium]
MSDALIRKVEKEYTSKEIPDFNVGDTIKVSVKIREGEKERTQVFGGIVISKRGKGTGTSFTVRKVSSGVGVERVFPLYSPNIDKIERVKEGKIRRAKLYYLRDKVGKSAKVKQKKRTTSKPSSNS